MQMTRTFAMLSTLSLIGVAFPLGGCEKKSEPTKPTASEARSANPAGSHEGHDHSDGHDHGDGHHHDDDHGHGATTQLGEQSAGGFTIKASRDGEIVAGKDAPIDTWVTGGTDKVVAVRFWIGTQDAKGSVKAKAELEKDHWHTHAEIPSPLPAGSKLWVEVETDKGEKLVAGFDLKQ
jgi:hypothetical protein